MLFGPEVLIPEVYNLNVKPVPPPETSLAYYRFKSDWLDL
jgi:hypothetical protein